ncbi:hypothetical protein BOTBODRAFT_27291 [Botryobasidium botryosum FD-172 SS1]|uniref:TRP C-terminal domain-containing protein n=1 Tax=Botryobasidium botryosum (strain FD-172 SS1) TaxID=930990 RepID=A0A067MVW7_BOTB1|nr:hypothetical protein BOTBODRAFT_27291 [Botryobasidium botryosum FD-172 SS1]
MAVEAFLGTRAQRGFILTVLVQAIIVLTMVAIAFGLVAANVTISNIRYRTLPCYLALFALAEVFHLILSLDALHRRNIIQLVGLIMFHIGLLVFSSIQIHQTHTALVTMPGSDCALHYANCSGPSSLYHLVEAFLIVVPCILAASLVSLVWFTRQLFSEFGWAVFHVVGADPRMKAMYRYYQVMICLLKFDFFCFVGLTMQLLILVLHHNTAEFGITIAAIPIVLLLLVACGIAVQREIKWLMTISLILMLGAQAYFLYKFTRLFAPSTEGQYITTRTTLAVFLIVAFILIFASFAVGLRCFADFDKGLRHPKSNETGLANRDSKYNSVAPGSPGMVGRESYVGGTPLQPRISIE